MLRPARQQPPAAPRISLPPNIHSRQAREALRRQPNDPPRASAHSPPSLRHGAQRAHLQHLLQPDPRRQMGVVERRSLPPQDPHSLHPRRERNHPLLFLSAKK
ncbi:hypothetical protein V8G54_011669 [Vigna mungo]|uniref:Uncharacterized protein n=1 Tax=Vigna mungo TaxID=3915 RepID=A0AAQ3S2J4_VIGMU